MVILRIIHATFTFAHIADMQSPVAVKSLYECQLYHLHREDEVNSHNGVGVMVGVEVGGTEAASDVFAGCAYLSLMIIQSYCREASTKA